jgi:hypothetical protein
MRASTGLATLALAPGAVFAAGEAVSGDQLAGWVGDRFYFANTDGLDEGVVKLIKVEQLDSSDGIQRYFVRFRGRRVPAMAEGLYSVTNWKGHPNFDVHVVPTTADRRGRMRYLATFVQLD